MKLYPSDLREATNVPYKQAEKACRYSVEQLAAANPKDLMLLIDGIEVWSVRIIAHAKIVTGGRPERPEPPVVVASTVSYQMIDQLIQTAIGLWKAKGMERVGPLFVLLGNGAGLWVQLVGYHFLISEEFSSSSLTPRYDIHGPTGLIRALSTMGNERLRIIPIDHMLQTIASFAESYEA